MKAFAYGVLGWSEKKFINSSIEQFAFACIGYKNNFLYQMQTTNNLNKRLAYAFCEIQTAKKKIEIEKYFELFEKKKEVILNEINELHQVANDFPVKINGKKG